MKETNDLAYQLFQDIQQGTLEYCYRGVFNRSITESILSLAETNLKKEQNFSSVKRRVYFIMVEGLQNITRHQELNPENEETVGIFLIQMRDGHFFITTGNVVDNEKVPDLQEKLEMVNSLDSASLKKYYLEVLENGELSKKGGAGLGLIEMCRKSGNKLYYSFRKINEKISYFYFNTKVPSQLVEKKEISNLEIKEQSLDKIIDFHTILNKENIILSFKGIFDQENMLNLLSMIEGQMNSSVISIKVFNVIMELLQNIVKHGELTSKEQLGKPGIFFISNNEKNFIITSGNYILAKNYQSLEDKINYVNLLENEELDDAYDKVLLDLDSASAKKTGLGLIDMRIKSENKLGFKFYKTDSEQYFYTLTIKIKKSVNKIEALNINPTDDTPEVILDAEKGIFSIAKRSYPENAIDFYDVIISWIRTYGKQPNTETTLVFDFEYFNTASSKQIMKIILELEKFSNKSNVKIVWKYKDIDEDMLSLGLRFQRLVNLNFEFKELKSE